MGHGYPRSFSKATGQHKFPLVAIDYFTKWVEAEVVALIIEKEVQKFIWKTVLAPICVRSWSLKVVVLLFTSIHIRWNVYKCDVSVTFCCNVHYLLFAYPDE